MPKIRIVEKDYTTSVTPGSTSNVICITDGGATPTEEQPFIEIKAGEYAEKKASIASAADATKKLVEKITDLGGDVVLVKSLKDAAPYLKDRNQIDVKFILVKQGAAVSVEKGSGEDTKTDLQLAMDIAITRRDCTVVYTKTDNEISDAEASLFKTPFNAGTDSFLKDETGTYGKYCLPWYANTLTTGKDANKTGVDAGAAYILAYLKAVKEGNPEWLAAAGSARGVIPLDDLNCGPISESVIDSMQPREAVDSSTPAISINPILKVYPWGVRTWGNRTAEPITKATGLTASHFANIRVLICDLKKAIYKASRQYQFEQNNDVLWVNFQSSVNTILAEMKQSYGIAGYEWVRGTSERAKLNATLRIIPIEPVEDFDITVALVDADTEITD